MGARGRAERQQRLGRQSAQLCIGLLERAYRKPGGHLRFASYVAHYVDWALALFARTPAFRWTAEGADDWRIPPADHITTRYEEKRLGDCAPVFLDFVRT